MAWLHLEIERGDRGINMVGAELTDDDGEVIAIVSNVTISQERFDGAAMSVDFIVPDVGLLYSAILPEGDGT